MDDKRVSQLHSRIFSTPARSPARDKAVSALNEADISALYDYDMGLRSGRIEPKTIEQEGDTMTYETFKKKSDSGEAGVMREISKFAMESPEKYAEYREKYQAECDERLRLHNRRLAGY